MNQKPAPNLRGLWLAVPAALLLWFGLYRLWCWSFAWLETLR